MFILLSTLSLFSWSILCSEDPQKTNLKVDIQNVRSPKGAVYIALYHSPKDFPMGKPIDGKKISVTGLSAQATFSVEPGDYAIAVYHDENGNGQMDKRVFGIPKEPYGFSNNVKPIMSMPKFSDCKFSVGNGGRVISIKLN